MAKQQTNSQATLTVNEVRNLYLALWELRDALEQTGSYKAVQYKFMALFGCIPDTTTNRGAYRRASNIRRKTKPAIAPTVPPLTKAQAKSHWQPGDGFTREDLYQLSSEQLAYLLRMQMDILQRKHRERDEGCAGMEAGTMPLPPPTTTVESEPVASVPTKRMRKAVADFDSLTDDEQVNRLTSLWSDE